MNLLPMDYSVLRYLDRAGGWMPTIAIPAKLFDGEIPKGSPDLVALGMIEHHGDITSITQAGREALSAHLALAG